MRIVVSGGGTAGHVSPVLAIADALAQRDSQLHILYIGQRHGMEEELVRRAGLRFVGVFGGKYRRIPGSSLGHKLLAAGDLLRNLRDVFLIGVGAVQCIIILIRFRPAALFNKGGPAGLPVGIAARLLRIPMIIHEPDIVPGLNNKILSRWATKVAVGFPVKYYRDLPKAKLAVTGTPVQPAIISGHKDRMTTMYGFDPQLPIVVIVGGSQGAQSLNDMVLAILPDLLKEAQVVHVVGAANADAIQQQTAEYTGYRAEAFLPVEDMADVYAAADIVVARAGANTITELAALHKPTVLVPNRQAAAHQMKNAEVIVNAGAAIMPQEDTAAALQAAITELLGSEAKRKRLAKAIAQFASVGAADKIADLLTTAVEDGR